MASGFKRGETLRRGLISGLERPPKKPLYRTNYNRLIMNRFNKLIINRFLMILVYNSIINYSTLLCQCNEMSTNEYSIMSRN